MRKLFLFLILLFSKISFSQFGKTSLTYKNYEILNLYKRDTLIVIDQVKHDTFCNRIQYVRPGRYITESGLIYVRISDGYGFCNYRGKLLNGPCGEVKKLPSGNYLATRSWGTGYWTVFSPAGDTLLYGKAYEPMMLGDSLFVDGTNPKAKKIETGWFGKNGKWIKKK